MMNINQIFNLSNLEKLQDLYMTSMQNAFWLKDLNGKYLSCNNFVTKKMMGLSNESDFVGLTDFDLPWNKIASFLIENDQNVIRNKK